MLDMPRAGLSIWTLSFSFQPNFKLRFKFVDIENGVHCLICSSLKQEKKLIDFVKLMQRNSSFFHRSFEAES